MAELDLLGHPIPVQNDSRYSKRRSGPTRVDGKVVVVTEPMLLTTNNGPHHGYGLPPDEPYLGNLVEIYDSVPRFTDFRNASSLDDMIRTLDGSFRGITYQVKVTAATIEKKVKISGNDGKVTRIQNICVFPGVREEFVEKAIRKISTHSSSIEGGHLIVSFTLYELRKELAEFGHDYKYSEIREALTILTKSLIQIVTTEADGSNIDMTSSYLDNLEIRSPSKNSKHYRPITSSVDDSRCKVQLPRLLSEKINQGQFRLYQYGLDMCLGSAYSRSLLRHLSLVWTNANEAKPFKLSLKDFIVNVMAREMKGRIHNQYRRLEEAVQELVERKLLKPDYQTLPVKAPKGKGFDDYIVEFYPTNKFVSSVIQASQGASRRRLTKTSRLTSQN